MWLLVALVIVLVGLAVLDVLLARRMKAELRIRTPRVFDSKPIIMWLPGAVARVDEQILPIENELKRHGNLVKVDFTGHVLSLDWTAERLARRAKTYLDSGHKVIVVGTGLSGIVAAAVVKRLKALAPDHASAVKLLLVDTPHDYADLVPLPRFLAPVFRHVQVGPLFSATIGRMMLDIARLLPVPAETVVPNRALRRQLAGREMDDDEYSGWVQTARQEHGSRYPFSLWWSEVAELIGFRSTDPISHSLDATKGVYLACTPTNKLKDLPPSRRGYNAIVAQPSTMQGWRSQVPHFEYLTIDSQHCEFLPAAPRWQATIDRSIRLLLT